jgi:hypothetical protein
LEQRDAAGSRLRRLFRADMAGDQQLDEGWMTPAMAAPDQVYRIHARSRWEVAVGNDNRGRERCSIQPDSQLGQISKSMYLSAPGIQPLLQRLAQCVVILDPLLSFGPTAALFGR